MKFPTLAAPSVVRMLLTVVTLAMLSGCGLNRTTAFSVIAPEINVSEATQRAAPVDWGLAVRRPVADRTRDSEQILVRTDGFRLLPFAGAVWLDAAPDLLRALIIDSLASSGDFAAVDRVGRGGEFFVLETELLRFEAVDSGADSLTVELELRASLVDPRGGALIAAETFAARQIAAGKSIETLIPAFETALADLIAELGVWAAAGETNPPQ